MGDVSRRVDVAALAAKFASAFAGGRRLARPKRERARLREQGVKLVGAVVRTVPQPAATPPAAPVFTVTEYQADPKRVIASALATGSAHVVRPDGSVRVAISIPPPEPAEIAVRDLPPAPSRDPHVAPSDCQRAILTALAVGLAPPWPMNATSVRVLMRRRQWVTGDGPALAITDLGRAALAITASSTADRDATMTQARKASYAVKPKRRRPNRTQPRKETTAMKRITQEELRVGHLMYPPVDGRDEMRPKTREACEHGERPCPWVSCRHHLALDINPETGSITLNFPHLDIDQIPHTCSLDVADSGGVTLERVGEIMNLTRERIRQIETRAKIRVAPSYRRDGWEGYESTDVETPLGGIATE